MKRFKHFTIDEDLAKELEKESNASKLVNELLKDYYNQNGHLQKRELEEKLIKIKTEINRLEKDMVTIERNLEKIEADEKRVREVFKNVPNEIIDDISSFENITESALFSRFKSIYKKKYEVNWKDIQKAFLEIKREDGNRQGSTGEEE